MTIEIIGSPNALVTLKASDLLPGHAYRTVDRGPFIVFGVDLYLYTEDGTRICGVDTGGSMWLESYEASFVEIDMNITWKDTAP